MLKLTLTILSAGVYLMGSLFVFGLLALGDEPGQFLLAVYADVCVLMVLVLFSRIVKAISHKKAARIYAGILLSISILMGLFIIQTLFNDSQLDQEFYTTETVAEVKFYLVELIYLTLIKMGFLVLTFFNHQKSPASYRKQGFFNITF
jgi:hypothetical protein